MKINRILSRLNTFNNKKIFVIEVIFVFIWLSILSKTDSYYSVYIIIGIIGTLAIYKNYKNKIRTSLLEYLLSLFFALCITLSNFAIYDNLVKSDIFPHKIFAILAAILVFIGGSLIFLNILPFIKTFSITTISQKFTPTKSAKTFLYYFSIFLIVDLSILFLCCYPGTLTADSMDEVGQLLSNSYSNHHPFYYTLLIKFFVSIGIDLFGDINIGIALTNIFQIIITSAAFSYAFLTLRQIGVSQKIIIPSVIITAILPYNIMYSFTIWKDVLFGACFLIFIVSTYRYFHKMTKHTLFNLSIIGVSGIVICLFRSNALIAISVSTIIFFIIFKKQYLKFGLFLCGIVICSFILKNPVLKNLNIKGPDTVESLSIPTQQIARVLVEKRDELSEKDIKLINEVADADKLIEAYNPTIHDPVKSVIRSHGNQQYLSEHKLEFIKLYLKLGLTYPNVYTQAWIEQTRGYWNGGYNYWRWSDEVFPNTYEVERTTFSPPLKTALRYYLAAYENFSFLQPLLSIGLSVWLLFIVLYLSISKKDTLLTFITMPLLATWATLLIATPVFAEFRYVYFIFTCLPFLLILAISNHKSVAKLNTISCQAYRKHNKIDKKQQAQYS